MSKLLIVGDLHLREKNLKDISSAWSKMMSWAINNKIDIIAQAGDVFSHVNVHGKEATVGTIYEAFLSPYLNSNTKIPTVLIPGNHDLGDVCDKDSLVPMDGYYWIKIFRKPCVTKINEELSICSIPWINKLSLMSKLINKKIKEEEAKNKVREVLSNLVNNLSSLVSEHKEKGRFVLCLAHLDVIGSIMDNGETLKASDNFELSPLELFSIGADAYGLAHIHKRQHITGLPRDNDGYLGTLCQLGFGEEKNLSGCRFLEIEGNKVIKDEWLDNKASPKYFTISLNKDDNIEDIITSNSTIRKGIDYVKIRGEEKPNNIPDGMIFEKVVTPKIKEKTNRFIDCNTPIKDLLLAWVESNNKNTNIEDLIPYAEQLVSKMKPHKDFVGSLDKINKIVLKNITCHENLCIDTSNMFGVCGIMGPNGSGKTTFIETMISGPFGKSPSRSSLNLLASQKSCHVSTIGIDLFSNSKLYSIRREFKGYEKLSDHKSFVSCEGKMVAGPKVGDVYSFCENLIGDPDMVLSGVFSSQAEAGNITDILPSGRKDLFAKLLGSNKFLPLSEMASKRVDGLESQIEVQNNRISQLSEELKQEDKDKELVDNIKSEILRLKIKIKDTSEVLDTIKEKVSKFDQVKEEIAKMKSKIIELSYKKEQIRDKGKELKRQKEEIGIVDIDKTKEELKLARESKVKYDKLINELRQIDNASINASRESSELIKQAESIRQNRNNKFASHVNECNKNIQELTKSRDISRKNVYNQMADMKVFIENQTQKLVQAKSQAESLEGIPQQDCCRICPLAKDGMKAKDSIQDLTISLNRLKEKIKDHEDFLFSYDEETKNLLIKLEPKKLEEWMVDELEKSIQLELKSENILKQIKKTSPIIIENIKKYGSEAEKIPKLEEKLVNAMELSSKISILNSKIQEKRDQFKEVESEISSIVIPMEPDDCSSRKLKTELETEIESLNLSLGNKERCCGEAELLVRMHEKRRIEKETIEKEISDKKIEIRIMTDLSIAFGRNGIPQMIVEEALPRFQEILSELLYEFDGKWAIEVLSQKTTKEGKIQDVIDIMVDAGDGLREVSTYSGGEKKILKTIVRIAFSTLQAERTGKGLKVLVLDEATDHVDDDNSEILIRMVRKLRNFNQIFIVSHNSRVLSGLPNKIIFSPDQNPIVFIHGETKGLREKDNDNSKYSS